MASGSNKGEITETLSVLEFMKKRKKEIIFGNRLGGKLKDDDTYDIYKINQKTIRFKANVSAKEIDKLYDELKNEILITKNENGSYEYKTLNKIIKLFNVKKNHLFAPRKYNIDIIADGINYSIKSKVGARPAIFNYSPYTKFAYKIINLSEKKIKEYKRKIANKEVSENDVLKEMINNGNIEIVPDNYIYIDKNGKKPFYEFLLKIDKDLPEIFMRVMYNKTKFETMFLSTLLNKNETKIFKKFVKLLGQGLTVGVFRTFEIVEMKEIHYDKKLNSIIRDCDANYADDTFPLLVVDRGSSDRIGFGEIYEKDGQWYFVDDMHLRLK